MKKYKDMTIPEFVEAAHIVRRGDKCGSLHIPDDRTDEFLTHLKAVKPQVMEYLLQQEEESRRAYEARQAKIDAIPGLREIKDAIADLEAWQDEWNASFQGEGGGGVGVRPRPKYDIKGMHEKYPRASAYLKAESYELAAHYVKSAAGRKANERIINGEDPTTVLADMEKEWSDYCTEHMWD